MNRLTKIEKDRNKRKVFTVMFAALHRLVAIGETALESHLHCSVKQDMHVDSIGCTEQSTRIRETTNATGKRPVV